MCNPRRVRVQATRKIAEAWRAEIRQAATARGDVNAEARLVQSISDLLPPAARKAFEQAVGRSGEWTFAQGEYRRAVPGGFVAYRPGIGELEIAIMLSKAIEAVAEASVVAEGEVVDQVSADASATWYKDVAGKSRKIAQKRAEEAAETRVAELAAARAEALKAEAAGEATMALNQRTAEVAAEAQRSARSKLVLQAEEMQATLDDEASRTLSAVQEETLKAIFQLVALGYSAAIQEFAAARGENLTVTEENGVIQIQFELES